VARQPVKVIWALLALLIVGCQGKQSAQSAPADGGRTVHIEPGPDAPQRIQEALIMAQPGQVVELAAGRYNFESALSLDVDKVTLRGAGQDKTILSFAHQKAGTGGEGVSITSDGVVIEDLAIEDTPGDALKFQRVEPVTVRRVRTEWTGGPKETNGGYGIYPVECGYVLVENCVATGASDAGIYVGQSTYVVVRHNLVFGNVAGIEIENCKHADVYENKATGNTGGILVFSLPNLPAGNGRYCRVFDNEVVYNNLDNFAPAGNIVGMVPPGTGIMLMAYDEVEVFGNKIRDNSTVNLGLLSYLTTEKAYDDPRYDPYCEAVYIHDNQFTGGGDRPRGLLGETLKNLTGGTFPDIVYDGIVDEEKLVDGRLPADLNIVIDNNGDADFVNLDLANFDPLKLKMPKISRDLAPHQGTRKPLAAVTLKSSPAERTDDKHISE